MTIELQKEERDFIIEIMTKINIPILDERAIEVVRIANNIKNKIQEVELK